ncbi:MAG: peptidylprolyl isomerase [Bacteroidota bacterium]
MRFRFFFLLLLGSLAAGAATAQDGQTLDEIVAVVEGEIVLRSDVNSLMASLIQQQQAQPSAELWNTLLGQLIDQKLMVINAEDDTTLAVTDDQLSGELDRRIAGLTQQVGGEQRLEEIYGQPILQIREELRGSIREQLLADAFQRKALGNVRVTPSEVKAWFEQFPADSLPTIPEVVRVQHVVRLPDIEPAARQEAVELITTIRDSVLTSDATIEDLAKFSDDPGSAENGGRYAGMRLSELVPEFGAVAATLNPGETSQIFETSFGMHFMRLNSRVGDVIDFNHILIAIDDSRVDRGPAVEYLETLRDSIVTHNVPVELIAKRHSEDSFSSQIGGYVVDPRTQERDLVLEALGPLWTRTLTTIDVGEVSEPRDIELLDGRRAVHIAKLVKRTPAHLVSLETDYERIEQLALQEKRGREREKWLSRLRENAYIRLLAEDT